MISFPGAEKSILRQKMIMKVVIANVFILRRLTINLQKINAYPIFLPITNILQLLLNSYIIYVKCKYIKFNLNY